MKDFEDLKKSITLGLVMCVVSIIMLVYQVNNSIIYAAYIKYSNSGM